MNLVSLKAFSHSVGQSYFSPEVFSHSVSPLMNVESLEAYSQSVGKLVNLVSLATSSH